MNELQSFYAELYQDNRSENCESFIDSFIGNLHLPKLTLDQRNSCDEILTVGECFSSLKAFQKNKTPGNDGLTVEFNLMFWPLVGKHVVDCFNYAHEHGEFSNSQKQAVITLLEKKGKDKRLIKNWHPISLINVDTKVISKTLAKRLEPILPDLIHYNQNAYVKGRSIFSSLLTLKRCSTLSITKSFQSPSCVQFWACFHPMFVHFIQIYQVVSSTTVFHRIISR